MITQVVYRVESTLRDEWIELPGFSSDDLRKAESGAQYLQGMGRPVRIVKEAVSVTEEVIWGEGATT